MDLGEEGVLEFSSFQCCRASRTSLQMGEDRTMEGWEGAAICVDDIWGQAGQWASPVDANVNTEPSGPRP